jgi:hypothetical protein
MPCVDHASVTTAAIAANTSFLAVIQETSARILPHVNLPCVYSSVKVQLMPSTIRASRFAKRKTLTDKNGFLGQQRGEGITGSCRVQDQSGRRLIRCQAFFERVHLWRLAPGSNPEIIAGNRYDSIGSAPAREIRHSPGDFKSLSYRHKVVDPRRHGPTMGRQVNTDPTETQPARSTRKTPCVRLCSASAKEYRLAIRDVVR